jgi:isoamylase
MVQDHTMAATWNPGDRSWAITLWSSRARAVRVQIVDREQPYDVAATIEMTRDGDLWSATVPARDVGDADLYGFRVDGPSADGSRFDASKFLVDIEARQVWFPPGHDRDLARIPGADTLGRSPFGVLPSTVERGPIATGSRHSDNDLVIYELHVRGLTMVAPHIPGAFRGTFAGLREHIPNIAALGVTAVELLPVHQFDPDEGNYWGYMPLAWNALHHRYVAGDDADSEFRELVQAFHDLDIEVLLDVVYNHSTEEDEEGPTCNLRAIDDPAYYVLRANGSYVDDAGCGNIVRAAHPAAGRLILDSLRRFADLGVDGFRFDLGSLLGRDLDGHVQHDNALIDEITAFAADRNLRLIVEAWDLAAYQLGDAFPGRSWAQWNGRFRDDCRAFLRAETGSTARFATRILGSPDLYGGQAHRSINFITAHDGFTLYDLVSYEQKHNIANGQCGQDGSDDNKSWNCGWEGDDIPADRADDVRRLRMQQMKNAMVLLLLAAGTPMIVAGDEFAQTQGGNNNPYNQDNGTTWLKWERAGQFAELTDFVRRLIALRKESGGGAVTLHGVDGEPDLSDASHSIAWQRGDLYVMANSWWEPLTFRVRADGDWHVALSSSASTGSFTDGTIQLAPRSTVVFQRTHS